MEKSFYQKVIELRDNSVREEGDDRVEALKKLEDLLKSHNKTTLEGCGIVSKDIVVQILEFLIPKPKRFSDYYQQVEKECPVISKIWFG